MESTGKWSPWPSGGIADGCDIASEATGPDHRPEPYFSLAGFSSLTTELPWGRLG